MAGFNGGLFLFTWGSLLLSSPLGLIHFSFAGHPRRHRLLATVAAYLHFRCKYLI